MMNKLNLFEKQWCDIVFENRNQAYGAYQLRKEDSGRTVFAMFATTGGLAIILALSYLGQNISFASTLKIDDGIKITDMILPPIEKTIEVPLVQPRTQMTLKEMVKNLVFKIEKNEKVIDDIKTNDELLTKNTGTQTIKGTGDDKDPIDINNDGGLSSDKNLFEDKETPRTFVEVMPTFIGGEAALFQYLSDNIKYPVIEKENNISGTVFLKFVVGKKGEISSIEVLRGVKHGEGLEKEAARVIAQMPKWKPGIQNGNAVPVYFTLPVKFTLRN